MLDCNSRRKTAARVFGFAVARRTARRPPGELLTHERLTEVTPFRATASAPHRQRQFPPHYAETMTTKQAHDATATMRRTGGRQEVPISRGSRSVLKGAGFCPAWGGQGSDSEFLG